MGLPGVRDVPSLVFGTRQGRGLGRKGYRAARSQDRDFSAHIWEGLAVQSSRGLPGEKSDLAGNRL